MRSLELIAHCVVRVCALFPAGSLAYASTNQFWKFLSRPDLRPPIFNFTTLNDSLLSPGYILLTPYSPQAGSNLAAGSAISVTGITTAEIIEIITEYSEAIQNGPYIYDQNGDLIWSGFGSAGGEYINNLKIAEFDGKPHLTYYAGNDEPAGNRGQGVIMDSSYHTVQTVTSGNGRAPNDVHEFSVINAGSTAIITIFHPTQYDLSSFGLQNIIQPWGWVIQGIFQEVDIASGEVLFEWRSLDHTTPAQSYNGRGSAGAGNGTGLADIWDYFHLNSVQKDNSGNYLISSRYLCTLMYINGHDGSVVWELNGKNNQFTFSGFSNNTFPFAFQHHARIHSQNETAWIISIFDNGSDGEIFLESESAGMIMAVDVVAKTCTLLKQYRIFDYKGKAIQSSSQGSMQLLENGNIFMGWGSEPYISEHTADGTLVMQGQFGAENVSMSYRAFKADWVGTPDSTPALWSAAGSVFSPTTFFVSWNGATEIASWRLFGGAAESACLEVLGTLDKTGFETSFVASAYYAWGYAQALSSNGTVLKKSLATRTYVPGQNLTVMPTTNQMMNITPATYRHVF